jgi:hypothetical protein
MAAVAIVAAVPTVAAVVAMAVPIVATVVAPIAVIAAAPVIAMAMPVVAVSIVSTVSTPIAVSPDGLDAVSIGHIRDLHIGLHVGSGLAATRPSVGIIVVVAAS